MNLKRPLTRGLGAALLVSGAAGFLASCGAHEAPSCSSPDVEALVSQLIASSSQTGEMKWILPFDLPNGDFGVGYGMVDAPGLAKAIHFTFSAERERGYDKEARKRACTANIAASGDVAPPGTLVSAEGRGLDFKRGTEPYMAILGVKRGHDPAEAVLTKEPEGVMSDVSKGVPVDFDQQTLTMLQKAFAGALPRYVSTIKWQSPQDYSVQLTDKGDTYVTLGE